MRTVVLGAGIAGVVAAYYLACDGDDVVLIDRGAAAASETSFANAGIVAPGHAHAWAGPEAPLTLLKSIWRAHPALRFRFHADPDFWRWSMTFLRNCTAAANARNTARKLRLCLYSAGLLKELADELKIEFDERRQGALYLHRDHAEFERACEEVAHMKAHGLDAEVADPDRCAELDPALAASRHLLAGGIYAGGDFSGDCRRFASGLVDHCRDNLAIETHFGTTIQGFKTAGSRLTAVETSTGLIEGDRFVLSCGSWSPKIAAPLGIWVPVLPVKGYSLTAPVGGRNGAPSLPAVDEHNFIAYSRLGDRLRVTAYAEFAGYDTNYKPSDFDEMIRAVRELLPDGADYEAASHWACLRPMTPQGPPVLGPAGPKAENLWLNTGHGHMGWSMACGAGRILADMMRGREPAIPTDGLLSINR